MAASRVPPAVLTFVKRWIALFDARNWKGLHAHEVPDPRSTEPADQRYLQLQAEVGAKAEVEKLARYVPPRWPILRTNDFVPAPTYWADIVFVRPNGGRNEGYLAIAPRPNGKGWCSASLEPKAAKAKAPKKTPLDLDAESARVGTLVAAAVKKFARRKDKRPVQALELSFSATEGTLTISFDLSPDHEPGELERMTHHGFEEILVPRWAEDEKATATRIGKMLVARLLEMRAAGAFEVLRPSTTAELGVSEEDGHFGWPPYAQRGRTNRLS